MSFWNRVTDILALLGQRLQTPEYLMCCDGEFQESKSGRETGKDPSPELPIGVHNTAAVLQGTAFSRSRVLRNF